MGKATILIIDDVAANIQLAASLLNNEYNIKVATSGKKGLEIAKAEPLPDLILLDIEMPEMNGYEVCRVLKGTQKTASIPIIFLTAMDQDSEEELGLELGAVDYITKPIRPAILKARIKTQVLIKYQNDQLLQMALHDQLTGLFNRRYLMETAHLKAAKSLRHSIPISAVLLDLDHFKSINDNHGHDKGDAVLKAVGSLLTDLTRKEDIAARLGGEEFIVLFDHCELDSAFKKSEELRSEIEKLSPAGIDITASLGVCQFDLSGDTFDRLLNRCDKALYKAKDLGRNQVVICEKE